MAVTIIASRLGGFVLRFRSFRRAVSGLTVFARACDHLAKGQPDAAWPLLQNAQDLLVGSPDLLIEVDMLLSLAAFRIGDWNLSIYHAKAAVSSLRDPSAQLTAPVRDYMLYYCRVLIDAASWRLAGAVHDGAGLTGVEYTDLRPEQVSKHLKSRFPITAPLKPA